MPSTLTAILMKIIFFSLFQPSEIFYMPNYPIFANLYVLCILTDVFEPIFGIYEIIEGRKREKKIIIINIAVKVEGKIKKN